MKLLIFIFASLLVHLAAVGILWTPFKSNGTVRIEIALREPVGDTAAKTNSKSVLPSASQEKTQSPSPTSSLLGSEFGIHAHYPRLSRVLGESGRVLLLVKVDHVSVVESSGFPRLDEAALNAAREGSPLLKKKLESREELQLTFIFKLKN